MIAPSGSGSIRAKLLRQRRVLRTATDRSDLVPKLVCKLNPQVPQAADPLHRNKIPRQSHRCAAARYTS